MANTTGPLLWNRAYEPLMAPEACATPAISRGQLMLAYGRFFHCVFCSPTCPLCDRFTRLANVTGLDPLRNAARYVTGRSRYVTEPVT